jgi:hypothetical protein
MTRTLLALALLATLAGVAGVSGCGYTETHEVQLRAPAPPSGRPVEVYMMGQPPPRPFYEVALLQVIGHGADANLEDVVKALTARASTLGCDALVRIGIDQGYSLAHGFGVCVRWAAVAPAPAPAPAPVAPSVTAPAAPVVPPATPAPPSQL